MLRELHVRELGVIEEIALDFGPGMTALTGETGAGKTLVIEAVQLLMGGRTDPALVRPGAAAALVEGRFEGSAGDDAGDPDNADPDNADELILVREIPATGRSRGWCNGRMETARALAEHGATLVDLHGQHDHMTLLTTAGQRAALDAFAGVDLAPLAAARAELAGITAALAALGGDPDERLREVDFLRYQLDELDRAGIDDPGEEAALAGQEELLAAADAHRDAAQRALMAMGAGGAEAAMGMNNSAAESLAAAITFLTGHGPFAGMEERLRALADEVADVGRDLRSALDEVREDPERLAEVRARRQFLLDLARKYGGSLEEARDYRITARERLEALEHHDADARALADRRTGAKKAVALAEHAVRKARAGAAGRLGAAVTERLHILSMPKATFEVAVGEAAAGDEVTFFLAANPGEATLPLAKAASGGELARATLAVRLVASGGPPTLVFDEVDAGIGGEAALAVGRALAELAVDRQVIVVTHLAQVAAFAHHQVAVTKSTTGDRTIATVERAEGAGRIRELARMLSGQPDSATARRHAEELLAAATGMRSAGMRGAASRSR